MVVCLADTIPTANREAVLKSLQYYFLAGLCLVSGCGSNRAPVLQTEARRQIAAKLRVGMSEGEVSAVLGQSMEFRPGNGHRDDVGVYRVKGHTFTIYFYQKRLTRYMTSQQPVNR